MLNVTTVKTKIQLTMNRKRLKFLTTTVCMLSFVMAQAQTTVNTTGGNASGTSGSASYSIGQLVYTTNASSSGSVAQGVQQPYEILTVGLNENEPKISLSVFPNPVADNLILQLNELEQSTLTFQLCDAQGKQISKGQVTSKQTRINTASLATATYFIHVVNQENKKVQTFKIIKN
jgi:hypothetical protein